jgi:hypothetical protein
MNTNTAPSVIDIVNKIPTDLYFSEIPDRQQVLKYLDYIYNNVPASSQIDQDKLIREVISRELRIVTMKIIEPEILLVVALDKISTADLSLPSSDLVRKVVAQNPDKYDLDIMQRVIAQIMTKLPRDIRDRVAGKHKLQIFQLVAKQLNMDPKLIEKFANYDPSLNTPITMELDKSDYNTLNKKYLKELYNFQKKQPYISANNLEYGALAAGIALAQPTGQATSASPILRAQYIDQSPDMMVGANDKKLYFFDTSSGTLSDFPVGNSKQTPVSIQDMKTILGSQKINEADIQKMINSLNPTTTTATTVPFTTRPSVTNPNITIPQGYFTQLENYFKNLVSNPSTTQPQTTQSASSAASTPTSVSSSPSPTQSNEPVPPEFIKKLYKLKSGSQTSSPYNQYNQYSDGYTQMMSGLGTSDVSMYGGNLNDYSRSSVASYLGAYSSQAPETPESGYSSYYRKSSGYLPADSSMGWSWGGYTQNNALPIFEVKNPSITYAAFSGPSKNTKANYNGKSQNQINMEKAFKLLNSTYAHNPKPTKNETSITSKSGFANLAANSQEVSYTIAHEKVNTKIKNDNKNVEKIAIGFITILILIFLIAVIVYAKNNS